MLQEEENTETDTLSKRQKLDDALSETSSYYEPNYYNAMVGDISSLSLYKSIKQEFWNNGKEAKISQCFVFINERMAVLYSLKQQMAKEVCLPLLDKLGPGHDYLFFDTEYLKSVLEEMNDVCERERFGTSYKVERNEELTICSPVKLYAHLLS